MKKLLILLPIAFVAAGMTGCREKMIEGDPSSQETAAQTVTFYVSDDSKVTVDPQTLKMSFEVGDMIGINGESYPVEKDAESGKLVVRPAKSEDGLYNCIVSGPQSYIGESDSNYKVPNFQIYTPDGFCKDAMPMICCKDMTSDGDNVLHFKPLMGVVKIPVNAEGISIRSVKLEDAGWAYGSGATYMSGRAVPVDASGNEVKTLGNNIEKLTFKFAGTAVMREIVLMCNDADGNGVEVDGSVDFYFVVEPREYSQGLKLTITTNDHRMMTAKTNGSTVVPVGKVITMQAVDCKFDEKQIFAENFDTCVWGGDPVGKSTGFCGWRGLLPRGFTNTNGTFGNKTYTGIERGHWYSDVKEVTDGAGVKYSVVCPGSDIYADYHANVFSGTYYDMSTCPQDKLGMAPSFFKYRGLWDWFFSRAMEYHGYLMIGRSSYFSSFNPASGATSTGSPQGAIHTPCMTNIPEGETKAVKLTFKVAKDFANAYQPFRIVINGAGVIDSINCGTLETLNEGGTAWITNFGDAKYTWTTCEVIAKGVTNKTFFTISTPDGKDEQGANYKTTTYFLDDFLVEEYDVEHPETALKVGFLGDSITTFAGWSEGGSNFYPFYGEPPTYPNTLTDVKDTYWYKIVFELMGNGTLDKVLAYGGTTVINNGKNPRTDFLYRCVNFENPDVIFIHGGTNDKNYDSPLGEYDYDLSEEQLDETKYRSAYIKLIKMLKRMHPKAQLLIIVGDMLTEPYYTSTEAIADHFGIPYVSFTGVSIPKVKGSHPDAAGMQTIASRSYAAFKQYLN